MTIVDASRRFEGRRIEEAEDRVPGVDDDVAAVEDGRVPSASSRRVDGGSAVGSRAGGGGMRRGRRRGRRQRRRDREVIAMASARCLPVA